MTWTWQDLVLFSGSVYGLAWLITRSKLLARFRGLFKPDTFFWQLFNCIVCTGTWVAAGLYTAAPWCGLFSPGFGVRSPVAFVVVLGWSIFVLWVVGRMTGDAD